MELRRRAHVRSGDEYVIIPEGTPYTVALDEDGHHLVFTFEGVQHHSNPNSRFDYELRVSLADYQQVLRQLPGAPQPHR
jgi:hypothetical protein